MLVPCLRLALIRGAAAFRHRTFIGRAIMAVSQDQRALH